MEQYAADAARDGPQVAGAWLPPESADDLLLDTVMLRLRLGEGLDLRHLAAGHPQGGEAADVVRAALAPHIAAGRALADAGDTSAAASSGGASSSSSGSRPSAGGGALPLETVQRVRLADPQGFVLSNDIISDVFAAFDLTAGEDD